MTINPPRSDDPRDEPTTAAPDADTAADSTPVHANDNPTGVTADSEASTDTESDADSRTVVTETGTVEQLPKGILASNPKLQILLIAAVFYAILIGMCLTIGIIVYRG